MELIPIIEASLSIFTVLMGFLMIISYLLYKLRGKTKKSSYLKELESDNLISIKVDKSVIIEDESEKVKRNERFKVIKPFIKSNAINEQKEPNFEKINVLNTAQESLSTPKLIIKPQEINNSLNIYNLYSNNSIRPMHKLKTQELTTVKDI